MTNIQICVIFQTFMYNYSNVNIKREYTALVKFAS